MILPLVLAGALGAVAGSFVTTAALRSAKGEQVITGRSHCDHCLTALGGHRTLPLVSYISSVGRCRDCGAKINPIHLAGEVSGSLLFALPFAFLPLAPALLVAALGLLLLYISVFDIETKTIYDLLFIPVGALSIALGSMLSFKAALLSLLVASVVGGSVLVALRRLSTRTGRSYLGAGDIRLVVALSPWLALWSSWALVIAAGVGLLAIAAVRPASGRLAFAPSLSLAFWGLGLCNQAGWLSWTGVAPL